MNIQQILYVLKVAECGSVSTASEELFISQSALSQQINRLELDLGYKIFERVPQGVILTEKGAYFCREADRLRSAWYHFDQNVRIFEPKATHLSVAISPRVFSNGLFDDIVSFFEAHPNIFVTFKTEIGSNDTIDLQRGTVDVSLNYFPAMAYGGGPNPFFHDDLIEERYCILVSHDSPLAERDTLSIEELHNYSIITGMENSMEDREMQMLCIHHGITFNKIYRSNGIEVVIQLVRAGKGIAMGPVSFAEYYGVRAIPIVPERSSYLSFICRKSDEDRPDIMAFHDHLKKICAMKQAASQL